MVRIRLPRDRQRQVFRHRHGHARRQPERGRTDFRCVVEGQLVVERRQLRGKHRRAELRDRNLLFLVDAIYALPENFGNTLRIHVAGVLARRAAQAAYERARHHGA